MTKSEQTGTFYRVVINFDAASNNFLLTLNDLNLRRFLCKKQQIPLKFVMSGLPQDE